jgi:hypothetical protein
MDVDGCGWWLVVSCWCGAVWCGSEQCLCGKGKGRANGVKNQRAKEPKVGGPRGGEAYSYGTSGANDGLGGAAGSGERSGVAEQGTQAVRCAVASMHALSQSKRQSMSMSLSAPFPMVRQLPAFVPDAPPPFAFSPARFKWHWPEQAPFHPGSWITFASANQSPSLLTPCPESPPSPFRPPRPIPSLSPGVSSSYQK